MPNAYGSASINFSKEFHFLNISNNKGTKNNNNNNKMKTLFASVIFKISEQYYFSPRYYVVESVVHVLSRLYS